MITGTTTIAFEYRAAQQPDGEQMVFRVEATVDDESSARAAGERIGRLVWKLAEGFAHGTATMMPIQPDEIQQFCSPPIPEDGA